MKLHEIEGFLFRRGEPCVIIEENRRFGRHGRGTLTSNDQSDLSAS
jgi:hypothetical protein